MDPVNVRNLLSLLGIRGALAVLSLLVAWVAVPVKPELAEHSGAYLGDCQIARSRSQAQGRQRGACYGA